MKEYKKETAEENINSVNNNDYEYYYPEADDRQIEIRGWLAFFLYVVIGLGSVIATIISLQMFKLTILTPMIKGSLLMMIIGMLFLAGFTIYGFFKGRHDAVPSAIAYLSIDLFSMLLFWIAIPSDFGIKLSSSSEVIFSILGFVIWVWYLMASKQVEYICPRSERRVTPYVIVPFILELSGVALMVYGFHSIVASLM